MPETEIRCWTDLKAENDRLRAALDVAREEIARLATVIGGQEMNARSRDALRELALSRVDRAVRGESERRAA